MACTEPSSIPTNCAGAVAGTGAEVMAAGVAAVVFFSSLRLTGAGLAELAAGGAIKAIGPEDEAFSLATGGDAGVGDGGAAHPLNAIRAMPKTLRFNLITLMPGPITEWYNFKPNSMSGRVLLVAFVAVHWSTMLVWLTCDKAVEEL